MVADWYNAIRKDAFALSPLACSLVVCLVTAWFVRVVQPKPEPSAQFQQDVLAAMKEVDSATEVAGSEMRARTLWGITEVLLVVALVIAIATCPLLIGWPTETKYRYLLILVAGVTIVASDLWLSDGEDVPRLVISMLRKAEQRTNVGVSTTTAWVNPLTVWGVLTVIFAVCSNLRQKPTVLKSIPAAEEDDQAKAKRVAREAKEHIHFLAEQGRCIRSLLLIGSCVLVAGVMEINALYRWPLALISDKDAAIAKHAESFVGVAVLAGGAWLSLLLVATFVPAFLLLSRRADAVASSEPFESKSKTERDLWLKENGFELTYADLFARLLAFFAPLLVSGPLVKLAEIIKLS